MRLCPVGKWGSVCFWQRDEVLFFIIVYTWARYFLSYHKKKKERIKSPPLQRKEKGNKKGMETWMLQEDLLMCPCVCIYVCVTASMFSLYVMCLNAVLWMLQTRDKQSVHSRETLNQWIWIMNNSPKALNSKENTVRVKVTAQCESERLTRTEKTGDRESFLLQSCQNIAVRTVG